MTLDRGGSKKVQKGIAGTLNNSILDPFFYFSATEFYKDNTKFQRRRGGRGSLGPPLNQPMI